MNSILRNSKWLLDENINDEIGAFLKSFGIEFESIKSKNWYGKSDSDILNYCFQNDIIILTQDADFGSLATLFNEQYFGIIYLRPGHFNYKFHEYSLEKLFKINVEIFAHFIVVLEHTKDKVKIRVRNH